MNDSAGCCPALSHLRPPVLNLDQFCILFESDSLCIARCDRCGSWLVNEGEYWEPLLNMDNLEFTESI
ncbi:hypothetical protein [Marinobacterium aestuariivivens]|uniref:Uncharacterized protein n=1 Tax=Marinobacterium aestuariivivens TaxID=1698799 RepID=A0ABW2A900_9GAMM